MDFFTDKSADAGLLDIFTINDGAPVFDANGNFVGMVAAPTMVAGPVNLNTTQAADLQSVFAGAILDELTFHRPAAATGAERADCAGMAKQIVSATLATPMQNKSELTTARELPYECVASAGYREPAHHQRVKARREVVARAVSSVAQTRVWNLVIDVVAQTGHFKPNASRLQNDFIVEGEQHYWVHVAIDRFTGQVTREAGRSGEGVSRAGPRPNATHDFDLVAATKKRNATSLQNVRSERGKTLLALPGLGFTWSIDRFDGTIVGQQLEEVSE